jgi:hypothetical protein
MWTVASGQEEYGIIVIDRVALSECGSFGEDELGNQILEWE